MNDLIKELAKQAGIAVWGDAVYMYDPKDTLDSTVMAKFAELIVGHAIECVRDVLRDENSDLSYVAASQVQKRLREFFGVEE